MGKSEKGILVVSFGTSYLGSKERSIDRIEEDIQNTYPDYCIYQAFTSKMIISQLLKRDGIKINTVKEAVEQMKRDGIRKLAVQPTHILNGIEHDRMKEEILAYKTDFDTITFGLPLLSATKDNRETLQILVNEYSVKPDEVYVFMGHGTEHYVNTVYAALDYMLKELGYYNMFVAAVEAYPDIHVVLKQLKKTKIKKVNLIPFMVVAGDHAHNDMAGNKETSWKRILEDRGYLVKCYLKGLCEIEAIRQIYLKHLRSALNE